MLKYVNYNSKKVRRGFRSENKIIAQTSIGTGMGLGVLGVGVYVLTFRGSLPHWLQTQPLEPEA